MNNQVATINQDKTELIRVLSQSLYVGAKLESIGMVIDYCQTANLDPMQKPVHIVPMNTRNPVSGDYEWRDVIMPGIGLYRIQADRSGSMAGISEPEFGIDITMDFTNKAGNTVTTSFPEWCKISVKKLVGNQIVEFIAKEYWIENYATDSGKSNAPNAMWRKRPRGQLAKCAEAQALRKGWPEIGQAPTAEEMEGKTIDVEVVEPEQKVIEQLPAYSEAQFNGNFKKWAEGIKDGKTTATDVIASLESKYTLTEQQRAAYFDVEVLEHEKA